MPIVLIEPVPRRAGKSQILAFLEEVGGLDRSRVGRIEIEGSRAAIEVPQGWESRLVKLLDGQRLGERRVRAWLRESPTTSRSEEDHFQRLARLLTVESQAEAQRARERAARFTGAAAEASGESLVGLVIADEDTGLGGRSLVELVKRGGAVLPWTRLDVGAPVVLSQEEARSATFRGVVYRRSARSLSVALAAPPDETRSDWTWRLDLSSDDVALERQRGVLERARRASAERLAELRDVLLGLRAAEFGPWDDDKPLNSGLNCSQRDAVRFALAARDVGLIHGPPGTGKTTAVVELIRRAVRKGHKVLACAPSNLAVDNLLERLLEGGERAVRLGHPARVLESLRAHTLDLLVENHPDVRLARKLVKEALGLFRRADRYTRARPEPGSRRATRDEARSLLDDARRLERQTVDQILDGCDVLCATTTGLDSELLGTRRFDLAVIDEAAQSIEPGCWIPLARCDRVVLAGDHCQLPPTVVSASGGRRIGGEPLRALGGPAGRLDRAAARRAIPDARVDHGLFLAGVLRRANRSPQLRARALVGRSWRSIAL